MRRSEVPEPLGATRKTSTSFGGNDAGLLVEGDAETVGEIEGFAGGEVFFYGRPQGDLGGVAQQVADDGPFLQGFFDLEQGLSGDEAIADGFIPGLGIFALTYYDIDAIIFLVQRLAGALYAVADDGYYFIFQCLLCFGEREFFAGDYIFFHAAEI
jgi:hypothetical protein